MQVLASETASESVLTPRAHLAGSQPTQKTLVGKSQATVQATLSPCPS